MQKENNIKILIDADGCPVVDITVRLARKYCAECLILSDNAHVFDKEGAKTLIFDRGADSVDFALVNLVKKGDIVITQDYGLAAMCISRKAQVINQDGMEYTDENIDALLASRHIAKKIRNSGGRTKGLPKRTSEQDKQFEEKLSRLLNKRFS